MCNHCHDHTHSHEHPEIVQIMPTGKDLYGVYGPGIKPEFEVETGEKGLSIVPILFLGLIRLGDKTMVEGFFASQSVNSCEDIEGFKGYAGSMAEAEKLYA